MGLKDFFSNLFKLKSESKMKLNSFEDMGNSAQLLEKSNNVQQDPVTPVSTPFSERAKEFVAGTVDEVKEQGSALLDEIKEQYDHLDEATKEYRDAIAKKAAETMDRIEDFVDRTVEKANDLKEKELEKDRDQDGIADKAPDLGKPIQETHKDFFDKAETWVDQHNSNHMDPEDSNTANPSKVIEPLELPKDPEESLETK